MTRTGDGPADVLAGFLEEHPRLAAGAALAPRAARHSSKRLTDAGRRLRSRAFFLFQCAVSAGVAWLIAGWVLGHEQPFFAPVAALVALGQSFGQRLERVVEIVVGVAVGVLVADALVHLFGSGYWQLVVIVGLSMVVATLLGAGVLMTTQAGVQAAFVTMIIPAPGEAFSRWTDAVVGGLVALAAATITPASPLRRPRQHAGAVVREISDILAATAEILRGGTLPDAEALLTRARASEQALLALHEAADDGMAVVRTSPFRRRHLPAVQAIADLLEPLDRSIRNLRVLVRRARVVMRQDERIDERYLGLLDELAAITGDMAASLHVRRLPEGALGPLRELAARTSTGTPEASLSAEVIRAQVRSMILDLLMVSGESYDEALTAFADGE